MSKKIVFFTRKNFGRLDAYITDFDLARALNYILKTNQQKKFDPESGYWPVSWDAMEGLKIMGYTFTQVLDPKKKIKK